MARRGGAGKPVVDRLAQTFARNRRDGDAGGFPRIELAQKTKKICRRLREILARTETATCPSQDNGPNGVILGDAF